ncbi:hypothetical protein CHLNCDRAFT_26372, partial [Chlorella variabilis]
QAILQAHNDERAQSGAPPLAWSSDLAGKAQSWADNCQLQVAGYGQNLGAGSAWTSCEAALPLWLAGKSSYTPGGTPPQGGYALSWTQVVWKGSTELGCGLAQCPSLGGFVVCFYNPPGNVGGRFPDNVGQA